METGGSLWLIFFLCLGLLQVRVKPDPDPLQDYCVADTTSPQGRDLFINGAPCINPAMATPSHFATSALAMRGNTANQVGSNVSLTTTRNLPGLNTQGLAMARVDFAARGIVPPHAHPRASEVTICIQGSILVGFINTTNHLFTQQLRAGDSFVFPKGLVHFLYNVDAMTPAVAVAGLNSQNPGAQLVSLATFATKPAIPDEVVERAFQITGQELARIRKNLGG
ncbi:germin-like protein subfamily 1 member 1 [Diospyros lotus]|uniref:germin-like protein subfamily 1 member 1 n=1 Tax=Diospyros lotus TaxID=55363 RepID=UPI002259E972|nr:germin-like protein subfamily 1 member 1 [Diospyros lotus]